MVQFLFAKKKPQRKVFSVCLELQALEDRLVPATLLWVGDNGTPNWNPAAGQNANFVDQMGTRLTPMVGDTLTFDPTLNWGGVQGGNVNSVDNFSNGTLSAIHINQGYTANITIDSYLVVGKDGQGNVVTNDPSNFSNGTVTLMQNAGGGPGEFYVAGSNNPAIGATFNWTGGDFVNGNGRTANVDPHVYVYRYATFNISGTQKTLDAELDNYGTVNFNMAGNSNLFQGDLKREDILNNGTFNLQSDAGILSTSTSQFFNYGLLEKNGPTGSSQIGLPFRNENASASAGGDFEIRTGTVSFFRNTASQGGDQCVTAISPGAVLSTFSGYTVSRGVLEGANTGSGAPPTISGGLTLSGGDFYANDTHGAQPGTFRISAGINAGTGTFEQTGGTLHIYVSGVFGNDQFQVQDQATLGGTLKVTTISAPSNPFVIMTYGSVVGDFASFSWDSFSYTRQKQAAQYLLNVPQAPAVMGVAPGSGPTTGGTTVTINGSNFQPGSTVAIGAVQASSVTYVSSTQLTAVSPPEAAAIVDITVTTSAGTSATSSADEFTYISPPTVTNVSPNSGPTSGGTTVTITGTNFTGATAVTFGSYSAASFTVVSATQITAMAPPEAAGTVDVIVTTAGGSSTANSSDQFSFIAPSLSINNVSMMEGNSGMTQFTFTVTLSAASSQTVTVNFATANGTATAGSDYYANSGTLTFNPGQTSQTITVMVFGDTIHEANETFYVNLSNAVNAWLSVSQGTGTILNDD
jgi:hypothetical protein